MLKDLLQYVVFVQKSKAKSKEAKPVACVSFKDLIKTYYFIDIDDDNRLQHSTVVCSRCRKRLEKCQNGQKQNQDLQTDFVFLESIWCEHDSGKQLSECSVLKPKIAFFTSRHFELEKMTKHATL